MKILCVCQQGNTRSWALAWMLKKRRHDALAVGVETASRETFSMLCQWADVILMTDQRFIGDIPTEFAGKVRNYNVGRDVWGNQPPRALIKKFDALLDGEPWNNSLPERADPQVNRHG